MSDDDRGDVMETTYYKSTRMDATTRGGVRWEVGRETVHPTSREMVWNSASTYLSLSVQAAETLIGGAYPCRLFRVVPTSDVITSGLHPYKRCVLSAQVVEELPGHLALGPNGSLVDALLRRLRTITRDERHQVAAWDAAWDASWGASWGVAWDAAGIAAGGAARDAAWHAAGIAARDAAWGATRRATWDAAGIAARYAACAMVVRDLLSDEHFCALTDPLFSVIGDVDTWGTS